MMRLLTKDNEGKLIGCKIQYADVVNGIPLENGRFYNFPAVARFFMISEREDSVIQ